MGYGAGAAITSGSLNILIGGEGTGNNITTGSGNIALGTNALTTLTASTYPNIAIGENALYSMATGYQNIAIGYRAGESATGVGLTLMGDSAGLSITSGNSNTYYGYATGYATTTGDNNTAIGSSALVANTTGSNNTAVGISALDANTTGGENTGLGVNAIGTNTTGIHNTAVGGQALGSNSTGNYHTAVGRSAGYSVGTNSHTTSMGYYANASATGSYNTAMGSFSGCEGTGDGHTLIGYGMKAPTGSNVRGHIGFNNGTTGTADYAITFGRSGTDWSRLSYGGSSFTTGSDERKKKDIADHPLGLDFINQLRTVNYHFKAPSDVPEEWDTHKASETEAKITTWQTGMLAQDVKAALDNLSIEPEKFNGWGQESDGMQTLDYGQFVMPLIKALQEADDKIDALTARIETLEG